MAGRDSGEWATADNRGRERIFGTRKNVNVRRSSEKVLPYPAYISPFLDLYLEVARPHRNDSSSHVADYANGEVTRIPSPVIQTPAAHLSPPLEDVVGVSLWASGASKVSDLIIRPHVHDA